MLKPLLTLLCSCVTLVVNSQEFRYSFSGKLTIKELSQLNDSLERYPIRTHRILLKSEHAFGEIIFQVDAPSNSDTPISFSTTDIKKTLLQFGLYPLDCSVFVKSEEQ